jgi:LmbE family N-acetylglucosaminyl deacetylase
MSKGGLRLSNYEGKSILAIGAQPEDLEGGVGGTLARLAKAGANVHMVVVSVPTNLEKRKEKAQKSASILGAGVRFLYGDECRRVEDIKTYELVSKIDALVRELQPAALLSHSLTNFHRDHVLVFNACLSSQRLAYFDFMCFQPPNSQPFQVPFVPQALVDITDEFETKMKAIREHNGADEKHHEETARAFGRLAGVRYAEGLEIQRFILQ